MVDYADVYRWSIDNPALFWAELARFAAELSTIEELKAVAEERFGRVDMYVSNAARRLYKDFFETTNEDWHEYLNQQLTASWYLAKAFVPGMPCWS